MMSKAELGLAELSTALKDDPGFAWSWHCNVAMCVMDEGGDYAMANKAASRFMKLAFDVETESPSGSWDSSAETAAPV